MPVSEVAKQLQELGIERGWGGTVGRIRSTMLMLGDIIQAPDPETLQASLPLPSCDYSGCKGACIGSPMLIHGETEEALDLENLQVGPHSLVGVTVSYCLSCAAHASQAQANTWSL